MAEKPKTYAVQVQELKDEIVQKDERINDLLQKLSFVDEMQGEIAHLREQLSVDNKAGQQNAVASKSQLTDAIQRAESAEQGLRNLQALSKQQIDMINSLEQQLDIAGAERDRNLGKEQKIQLLAEELKTSNLLVATLNQRLKDMVAEHDKAIVNKDKELRYLRELTKAQGAKIVEFMEAIKADSLSELRRLANG